MTLWRGLNENVKNGCAADLERPMDKYRGPSELKMLVSTHV